MKKTLVSTALFLSMAAGTAFAHHPAADIVDPEIYAMIDENVADTPHADLTFDDMGGNMESAARDEMDDGAARVEAAMEAGTGGAAMVMESRADLPDNAGRDAVLDTFTLLEDMDRAVME